MTSKTHNLPKHQSAPNRWRLQRIARSTTRKPIILDYHPERSMTDGIHIYISTGLIGDEEITLITQTGSTYHESFHVMFTDFKILKDTLSKSTTDEDLVIDNIINMWGNLCEDVRIESAAKEMFKGASMYLQMKNFALMTYKMKSVIEDLSLPEHEHIIHTATSMTKFGFVPTHYVNPKRELRFIKRVAPVIESAVTAKNTKELIEWAEFLAYEYMTWYPDLVKEQVEKMKEAMSNTVLMIVGKGPPGMKPANVDIKKPLNVILVILEDPDSSSGGGESPPMNIVDILDLRDEKKPPEDGKKETGSGKGKGEEGDEGEDEEGDEGEGKSEDGDEGEDSDSNGEDEVSETNETPDDNGKPGGSKKASDRLIDSHPELTPDTKRAMKRMMKQASDGVAKDMKIEEKIEEKLTKQDQKYVDVGNVKQVGDNHRVEYIRGDLQRDYEAYKRTKAEWSRSAATIGHKIRNLLLDAKRSRHVRNLPSGDLDRRSIYRIETSNSLFKRTEIPETKDTVFTILVDHSLSMSYDADLGGGKKSLWASRACIVVAEILSHIPDCDFEIIGFNGWSSSQSYYLYKSYGEPYNDRVKAALAVPKEGNGNVDAAAIELAVARQDTMPQQEKIIIVISDGNPTNSPYHTMSGKGALHHVLEKFKHRKIIGIGITGNMAYTPAEYYKHHIIVKDVRRLPQELVTVVRRILRR